LKGLSEDNLLEDPGVDVIIILKWVVKIYYGTCRRLVSSGSASQKLTM
jgi:hypothetical protein